MPAFLLSLLTYVLPLVRRLRTLLFSAAIFPTWLLVLAVAMASACGSVIVLLAMCALLLGYQHLMLADDEDDNPTFQ